MEDDDIESFRREAELAIQELCSNDKVDKQLREHLLTFRPEPGEKGLTIPHLTVEVLEGEGTRLAFIPVLEDELWNTKEARRNFIRQLGAHFAEKNLNPLVAYVLTEGWAKEWPDGREYRYGDIRRSEVKREIIIACALTIDRRAGAAMAEILRDDQARISGYGEIEAIACGSRQENGEPAAESGILEPFFQSYLQARFGPQHAQSPVLDS